jgi:norsolorinic acid ketoreductase
MLSTTNILITGSNRGEKNLLLWLSFLLNTIPIRNWKRRSFHIPRQTHHTLIAGVRDPTSPSSRALLALPHGKNSKVILVKIDSPSETDALTSISTLKSDHQITKLDIVIANAGIANYFGRARVTPIKEMISHYQINVIGPLLLFQATAELLDASPSPKFFTISLAVGSVSYQENPPLEAPAYGSSKVALNFVSRRIHFENPNIVVAPVHPGWLQTDVST